MKYLISILAILTVGSIAIGLLFETPSSPKMIGIGIAGLFFVVFPLFIYYRWKDKDIKDYLLTNENIEKMRQKEREKKS